MGKDNFFRVIDTGPLTAAQNMAMDQTILESCDSNIGPDTIRFLSFEPHCALVGRFQSIEKEIRTDYCRGKGIDTNRRITGGGALYWDTKDIGWEIFSRFDGFFGKKNIESFYGIFCSAVASGINGFGISSRFRRRNDIEVNGKKISGSGGTSLQNAFMFQGTLLVDIDIEIMLRALRIPVEKLKYKEVNSLKERITWLSRELGYCPEREDIIEKIISGLTKSLGIKVYRDKLLPREKEIYEEKLEYFQSREYIYGDSKSGNTFYITSFTKSRKKVIKCSASIDIKRNVLRNVIFRGDFFIYPQRAVNDIESFLKNLPADIGKIRPLLQSFYRNYPGAISGISCDDITDALGICIDKIALKKYKIPFKYFNDIYLINSRFSNNNKIEVFLLPYCAKLPDCRFRKKQGCTLCGKCSISDAEKIIKDYGIRSITILSFEHLRKTLLRLKEEGIKYFGGSCCESFFLKHKEDFERIGLPGILLNIENTTCYDLGRETDAYSGNYEGFTDIKIELLKKILDILS